MKSSKTVKEFLVKLKTSKTFRDILVIIIVCCSLFYLLQNAVIRLDKIPIVSFFVLEKPGSSGTGFDATSCSQPITWEQIDNPPSDFDKSELWLYLNDYTKWLLKHYMKKNNLAIVPLNYCFLESDWNFDKVLETFEFVSLDEE